MDIFGGRNSFLAKVKDFIARAKDFIELRKDKIKIVAIPVLVIAAVLFFWMGSGDEEITVDGSGGDTQVVEESTDAGTGEVADGVAGTTGASSGKLYVDISGEVERPGVYEVSEGTRLFEVIEQAGGLTDEADIDSLNRAETVADGQKILIAAKGENSSGSQGSQSGSGTNNGSGTGSGTTSEGKVNINMAESAELQTIPGIGPSKAARIIEYRQSNGNFSSIEDIQNVSGIGSKTFESIKDYITV
jgi:competence protein ComEA